VIIGGLNVAFLFPILFSEAEIGLLNILVSIAAILAQISCLGSNGMISYFFPRFEDKISHHKNFFSFIFLYSLIGFFIFSIAFILTSNYWITETSAKNALLSEYSILLLPLTFFTLCFLIIDSFASSTLNATLGSLYKELIMRIVNTILILLHYFKFINFEGFLWLYIINFAIPVIAVASHLYKKGDISFKLPSLSIYRTHIKSMSKLGIFFILNGLSNSLSTYIDKLMITFYLGLSSTGIYSVTNFIGTVVRIPRLAMGKISTPLIAKAINDNDQESLKKFFRLSAISQIIVGFLIFMPIWSNIDIFLSLLPPSYAEGKWVVLFISASFLTSCILGVGIHIIQLSKHYKLITYFNLINGFIIVGLNALCIPLWGITGAALATLISKLILICMYLFILNKYFRLKIFQIEIVHIILTSSIAIAILEYIPITNLFDNAFFNSITFIALRSVTIIGIWLLLLKLTGFFQKFRLKELAT